MRTLVTAEMVWPRAEPLSERAQLARAAGGAVAGFAALWLVFYGLFVAIPYISSGSELVYRAKLEIEQSGEVFPPTIHAQRLLVFGDSRILSGFVPSEFDRLAAIGNRDIYSFNAGFTAVKPRTSYYSLFRGTA
jgi:hypothetical protein